MKPAVKSEEMQGFAKLLAAMTSQAGDVVLRSIGGFVAVPLLHRVCPTADIGLVLLPFLIVLFLLLRVVPAVLRKVLHFPQVLENVWTARRQLAKRHDSFQWQKVFWVGLGLAAYLTISGQPARSLTALMIAAACILSGAIGLLRWRTVGVDARAKGIV